MARERKLTKKKAIKGVRTAGVAKFLGRTIKQIINPTPTGKKLFPKTELHPTKSGSRRLESGPIETGEPLGTLPPRVLNPKRPVQRALELSDPEGTVRDQIRTPVLDFFEQAERAKRVIPRKKGFGKKRLEFKRSIASGTLTGKQFRKSIIKSLRQGAQELKQGQNLIGEQKDIPRSVIRKRMRKVRKEKQVLNN